MAVPLLLAIHLGCFFIEHLRVSSAEEKRLAKRISTNLAERVASLRPQLLNEVKTELLELRSGKVAAIEAGDEGESNGERV
jgi:hypothetical protein